MSTYQVLARKQDLSGTVDWSLAMQTSLKGNLPISQKLNVHYLDPESHFQELSSNKYMCYSLNNYLQ